jgi:Aspartyl/Asparaginyl beta-hydroxylase
MKNFIKIAENIDVNPILLSLINKEQMWGANPIRTGYANSAHKQAKDIIVRFNDTNKYKSRKELAQIFNDIDVVWYLTALALPQVKDYALEIMHKVKGYELGRVILSRLPAGAEIDSHIDEGKYADYYDRFHLCLSASKGSLFIAGNEAVEMFPGELWWFNRKVMHSVKNTSDDDRIHLVVDVKLFNEFEIVQQVIPNDND